MSEQDLSSVTNPTSTESNSPQDNSAYYSGKFYDLFEAGTPYYCHQKQDISFWLDIARKYGDPILELACGTGRVAIPLAEEGFQVTGIDISESMLQAARQKSSQVGWIKSDVRDFNIEKKFTLVIFTYNTLQELLYLEEIESCFSCVRRHLELNGGKFVIDIKNPTSENFLDLLLYKKIDVNSIFQDPDGKGTIVVTRSREYDSAQQIVTLKLFFRFPGKTEDVVNELKLRRYFPKELEALLKYNGFTIESKFGDYDGTPFTSESPQQLVVCSVTE